MKYCLTDIYPNNTDNGYGKRLAEQRFNILKQLNLFTSILDVGSGPCLLQQWLTVNFSFPIQYEAVDIRQDTLALCDCMKYTTIPTDKKYDLVCLFGTVTYNIDYNTEMNKEILKKLLIQSKFIGKQILFTVLKESTEFKLLKYKRNKFIYFSKNQIKNIISELGLNLISIIESDLDPDEYFVVCEPINHVKIL